MSTVARWYLGAVLVTAAYPALMWTVGNDAATGWEHLPLVLVTAPGQLASPLLPNNFTGSSVGVFAVAAIGALIVLVCLYGVRAILRHRLTEQP